MPGIVNLANYVSREVIDLRKEPTTATLQSQYDSQLNSQDLHSQMGIAFTSHQRSFLLQQKKDATEG